MLESIGVKVSPIEKVFLLLLDMQFQLILNDNFFLMQTNDKMLVQSANYPKVKICANARGI